MNEEKYDPNMDEELMKKFNRACWFERIKLIGRAVIIVGTFIGSGYAAYNLGYNKGYRNAEAEYNQSTQTTEPARAEDGNLPRILDTKTDRR